MARTDTLGHFLTDVADAIREKTGSSEAITASNFDTIIENIPSGGGADLSDYFDDISISNTETQCGTWIYSVKKLGNISYSNSLTDIKNIFKGYLGTGIEFASTNNTSNVTNFNYTFSGCTEVTSLDLSTFNTSNGTNMSYMFSGCRALTSLNLNMFNTSNVNTMANMFNNCRVLVSLDVSSFDTKNVTTMYQMFSNCWALSSLDLSNFETNALTNTTSMFNTCKALTHIDMRKFDFTGLTNYTSMFGATSSAGVPDYCEIIVADATQKAWINTNFSRLTNVKTVAEYEAE